MSVLRNLLWRWQMSRVRHGMTATEVKRRFGAPTRKTASGNIEVWIYDKGRDKDVLHSIRVAFVDACVSQVYLGMELVDHTNLTEKAASPTGDEPFMEHPTGEHENAVAAMDDAVRRLRVLPSWQGWITFCAQGEDPARAGTIKFAEIRMRGDMLDVGGDPLDVALISEKAGTSAAAIRADGESYAVADASSREVALLLDAIFREHFGIRPFADEDDDYAVGAEW
jgi:hypothetical protein